MKNSNLKQAAVICCAAILAVVLVVVILNVTGKSVYEIPIKKGSSIVSDGNVYYTNPDGDSVRLPAGEKKGELWIPQFDVMAVNDTEYASQRGESIIIYAKDESTRGEVYDIVSNSFAFNDEALYYRSMETGYIMKIDRATRTETALMKTATKKVAYNDGKIVIVPDRDNGGIIVFDEKASFASQYAVDITIGDCYMNGSMLIYSNADEGNQVYLIDTETGENEKIKGVTADRVCYESGVIYYIKNVNDEVMYADFSRIK